MSGSINTRLPAPRRRLPALVAIVTLAAGLGGCGESDADQVRDQVRQLAQATATRDYATICYHILAPSLVAHLTANNIPCTAALGLALSEVRNPVVSVGKVIVRGSRATAITLTSARGQRAKLVAIELRRTRQGWRITSLASPLTAGATGAPPATGTGNGANGGATGTTR